VFLRRDHRPIEPRKKWPNPNPFEVYHWSGWIDDELRMEEGRALCLWGDAGWGRLVRRGKYEAGRFDPSLADGCLDMIRAWNPRPRPVWMTCVPSLTHPRLVPDFAKDLARRLGLPFVQCIRKIKANAEQKTMRNSFQQARNLDGVFEISDSMPNGPVFLVDDMVDSRWTFTVLAALLRQRGCEAVFPLALALNSL
jgi:ATP-dependent DNA helicase RecQ